MKKRLLATALCASMVLSSTVALAAPSTDATGSGNSTGAGTNEGLVDTEIYSVTLPTVAEKTYDFFLDPQDNIDDTAADRYGKSTITTVTNNSHAYFKTSSSSMTDKSASASVVNASYNDLDVTVKVEVTGNTAISIEEAGTITNKTPTMFMGLESEVREDSTNSGSLPSAGSGTKDTSYVPSSGTLEKKFTLTGDSADYTKSWNSGETKYEMANTKNAHANSTLDFNLVVGCNTVDDADWTGDAATEAPSVEVTWSYAKHVDKAAPSIATKNYTLAQDSDVVVNVNLGAGDLAATGIASLTYTSGSGAVRTIDASSYSFSGGSLTINSAFLNTWVEAGVSSRDVKVIFNDTAATEVTLTLASSN